MTGMGVDRQCGFSVTRYCHQINITNERYGRRVSDSKVGNESPEAGSLVLNIRPPGWYQAAISPTL